MTILCLRLKPTYFTNFPSKLQKTTKLSTLVLLVNMVNKTVLRNIVTFNRTCLRPVGYPIKFILPEFVSYSGERGELCVGNGSNSCTPVLMNMCNNVSGP